MASLSVAKSLFTRKNVLPPNYASAILFEQALPNHNPHNWVTGLRHFKKQNNEHALKALNPPKIKGWFLTRDVPEHVEANRLKNATKKKKERMVAAKQERAKILQSSVVNSGKRK
ncbi:hypothetical protein PROFUN_07088 [Planoprotostelium fungivorum]|uniref:Uncharacterized protein n=1 Tax=Planoprotostelium fungivorum TaxID=1890364 RepID=A0A2P6NN36_9EUKA|nr:hypothetical protein PROFUN_07088 [Planoprotostelium fungivorum]